MITQVEDLTRQDYELIRKLVYAHSGINLGDQKMQLVRARLGKRMREGGFGSFGAYYRYVQKDATGEELCRLLDAISTNTTHLFREARHFELLGDLVGHWMTDTSKRAADKTLRIWSAGCSSGEEPFSIAMVAHDRLRDHPAFELKILATDLSTRMLSRAKLGLFESHRTGTVPPALKHRYLARTEHNGQAMLQITPDLRKVVTFSRFNLMTPTFPFRHGFHVVFCRNVMIYFDRPTQQCLVNKFTQHLLAGGYLMIGHSESLNGIEHSLSYVEPTVYKRG
jgi:chemotaxis protein methyltransferase CheR